MYTYIAACTVGLMHIKEEVREDFYMHAGLQTIISR
jgi:hypothetical protein